MWDSFLKGLDFYDEKVLNDWSIEVRISLSPITSWQFQIVAARVLLREQVIREKGSLLQEFGFVGGGVILHKHLTLWRATFFGRNQEDLPVKV